jgi:hypothetical protein
MHHLKPDQLLDVAEGTRVESEFPHLESCAVCAGQLADVRNAIGAAAAVQVPEPSPLFWDHLSARIRTAAAEDDRAARRSAWAGLRWWQWTAAAAVLGVFLVIIWPGSPRVSAPGIASVPAVIASVDPTAIDDVRTVDDDPALALLADLSAGLDWDAAFEAGLMPVDGTVDSIVFAMSAEERVELHRLLQDALAKAGA